MKKHTLNHQIAISIAKMLVGIFYMVKKITNGIKEIVRKLKELIIYLYPIVKEYIIKSFWDDVKDLIYAIALSLVLYPFFRKIVYHKTFMFLMAYSELVIIFSILSYYVVVACFRKTFMEVNDTLFENVIECTTDIIDCIWFAIIFSPISLWVKLLTYFTIHHGLKFIIKEKYLEKFKKLGTA